MGDRMVAEEERHCGTGEWMDLCPNVSLSSKITKAKHSQAGTDLLLVCRIILDLHDKVTDDDQATNSKSANQRRLIQQQPPPHTTR